MAQLAVHNSLTSIYESIRYLIETDPQGFLILEADAQSNRYLQFTLLPAQPDGPQSGISGVYLEASANRFIAEPYRLSPAQQAQMLGLGWREPSDLGSPNYSASFR